VPVPNDPDLVDETTGLSNERHFDILYDFAFAAGDRGIPLTLVMIQVDDVGAASGDGRGVDPRVARAGALLGGGTRDMDVVAHLGGGRFICLLMDCNFQGGVVFSDRIRRLADNLKNGWQLSLSLGMASYREGMEEAAELRREAVRSLEKALKEGGDRLVTTRDL